MSTNNPMTQERLDAMRARVEGATAGPWEHDFCGNVDQVETQPRATSARIADNLTSGDADLIANAPTDLAILLAEVEWLRADNERLRALTTVDDAMVERVARELAGLDLGEDWPSNHDLGGGLCGTRDDEYRGAMHEQARAVLNAALGTGEDA